jgi:hypothetical protein
MDMRTLQQILPWGLPYSDDFRATPMEHKDFAHALAHVAKATGALFALVDDLDHGRHVNWNPRAFLDYRKYVADLVICALRIANTMPGQSDPSCGIPPFVLWDEVIRRLESKNGVKLAPPADRAGSEEGR